MPRALTLPPGQVLHRTQDGARQGWQYAGLGLGLRLPGEVFRVSRDEILDRVLVDLR